MSWSQPDEVGKEGQAEEPLHGSAAQLQTFLDHSSAIMFVKDLAGRYLFVNRQFDRLLRTDSGSVLGRTDLDIFPSEQAAAFLANDRKVLQDLTPITFEEVVQHNDGPRPSLVCKFPLLDTSGRPYAVGGIVTDITDRKRAEDVLRLSVENLHLATGAARVGMWFWDLRTGTLEWTPICKALFGLPADQVLTYEVFLKAVHPDDRERTDLAVRHSLSTHSPYRIEYRTVWPDASEHWLVAQGQGCYDNQGQPFRMVGIVLDITDRKRMESNLAIQYAVTRILAVNPTLAQAKRELLRIIGEHTGWEVGVLWTVDHPANVLRCAEVWEQRPGIATEFAAELRTLTLALGGGLPGQVWATGEPAWVADVGQAADCPVAPLAVRSGMHGVFAFALRSGSDVEAVMVFLSPQIREPGEDLLHILTAVGGQIGQFMARKQTEEQLGEQEQRFRQLAEAITEVFWLLNRDATEVLYVSPAYEAIWGRTCQSLYDQPQSFLESIHPEDRKRVTTLVMERQKAQARSFAYAYRIVRPDGSIRWIRDRGFPIQNQAGEVCRFAGIAEDITERKQAEEAVDLYKQIIAHSSEAIAILDLQGRYLEQNDAHRSLTGHTNGELHGSTPAIHIGEEAFAAILRDLTSTGVHRGEYEGYAKDGEARTLDLSVFAVRNSAGEPMCYVEIERDITKRRSMERQLRQAEKMAAMGTLIAGVSHEINNPLFALSGYLDLASEKVRGGEHEGLAEDLAAMREAVERATAMVRRFLAVTRSQTRHRESCAVNVVVEQGLELVANDCLIHGISISRNLASDLPLIAVDPQELLQVLLNLFTNARQAMTAQGRGTVSVTTSLAASPRHPVLSSSSSGAWIEIRVQDDGPGIAPEHRGRVFEPFFTTKPVGEGTGLGLSMSHRIVTEHGGTLTCQSDLGRGATFMIQLPVGTSGRQEAES